MDFIINLDTKLFLYLNNLGSPAFDQFWMYISDEFFWVPAYLILTIIIFEKFGWRKALMLLLLLGLMVFLTNTVTSWVKDAVQRLRPCRNHALDGLFRMVYGDCRGRFCFFSAHAANTFSLATFLSVVFKKHHKYAPYLLFLWASLNAYSRIYLGVHFPLDIVTGVLFGLLMGWIFSRPIKYII